MKKFLMLLTIMIQIAAMQAVLGFDISANPQNLIETSEAYILDFEGKILSIDKASLSEKDVKITDDGVFIEAIHIRQVSEGNTKVYYGSPNEEILKSNASLVYVVEHYYPDLEINDPKRTEGWKRLTTVIKDAQVEVKNGIILRTDGLKVDKNSFFENSDDREIDVIKEDRLFEIYTQAKDIIIRTFRSFKLNQLLDRGYTGVGENLDLETVETEGYYDVLEGDVIEGEADE
jgi:hypothetical protein